MHGWAVSQRILDRSRSVLEVNQGSLYPALHRLEDRGWVAAEWGVSENNRRARFYRLTAAGRRQLAARAGGLGALRRRGPRNSAEPPRPDRMTRGSQVPSIRLPTALVDRRHDSRPPERPHALAPPADPPAPRPAGAAPVRLRCRRGAPVSSRDGGRQERRGRHATESRRSEARRKFGSRRGRAGRSPRRPRPDPGGRSAPGPSICGAIAGPGPGLHRGGAHHAGPRDRWNRHRLHPRQCDPDPAAAVPRSGPDHGGARSDAGRPGDSRCRSPTSSTGNSRVRASTLLAAYNTRRGNLLGGTEPLRVALDLGHRRILSDPGRGGTVGAHHRPGGSDR